MNPTTRRDGHGRYAHYEESSMELDDFKLAWQTLDQRLQQHNALGLQLLRERGLDRARKHLRPLWWGQVAQMLFGLACVLLGATCWNLQTDQPPLLVAGIVVHAYGIATMIAGGVTLGLIGKIDYAAPVVRIQKQLAKLRRFYVASGAAVGLAWWVLWVPFLMVLAGLDRNAEGLAWLQSWVYISLAFGFAGLLATWWFHRWSRHPSRPRLTKAMDDSVTGGSLLRAQARIDEIERFERQ
ncbi:serine/threonine protein kinase [Lysobacter sp. A289]